MSSDSVSRLQLERWALGDLDADASAELEARAAADPELSVRMERIRSEIDTARVDLPAIEPPPATVVRWPVVAAGVVAALAAGAVAMVGLREDPGTTFRGAFELELERVRDSLATEQGALIEVWPGDRIQYVVTPDSDGVLGVFDVQDDGQLFVWMEPTNVVAHVPVKGAAELDDYDGTERVYFVFGDEPFTVEDVEYAIDESWRRPIVDQDALPIGNVSQRSVLLVRP